MITATRLMTNEVDDDINGVPSDGGPLKRVNFKHAVAAVFRNVEALAFAQAVTETVSLIVDDIARRLASIPSPRCPASASASCCRPTSSAASMFAGS